MRQTIENILEFTLLEFGKYSIDVWHILAMILILLAARILLWLIDLILKRRVRSGTLDAGKKYAIYQILSYIIYVIAIILGLDSLGVKITVLLAGSTALFVGLGLGLQDFFRDLVAGFIILSERTVTSGDVVEIAGIVGEVKEVGLRTTTLRTRDEIVMVIPNTKLTNENVINWSQNRKSTRFAVDVGVAYGSDTRLVESILIECAKNHAGVAKNPTPIVHFTSFGDSSLDFRLLFHSNNLFRIETVKSELRFAIDQKFRESNITIPFPQRTLHLQSIPQQWKKNNPEE
jgi:small-conductance mechanosensitive channel